MAFLSEMIYLIENEADIDRARETPHTIRIRSMEHHMAGVCEPKTDLPVSEVTLCNNEIKTKFVVIPITFINPPRYQILISNKQCVATSIFQLGNNLTKLINIKNINIM